MMMTCKKGEGDDDDDDDDDDDPGGGSGVQPFVFQASTSPHDDLLRLTMGESRCVLITLCLCPCPPKYQPSSRSFVCT
jgi:hypothetical protein